MIQTSNCIPPFNNDKNKTLWHQYQYHILEPKQLTDWQPRLQRLFLMPIYAALDSLRDTLWT